MTGPTTPARVLATALTMTVVLLAVFLVGGPIVRPVAVTVANLIVVGEVVVRLRRSPGRMRLPFALLLAGFMLLVGVNAIWIMSVTGNPDSMLSTGLHDSLLGAAYLFLLGAAFIAIAPTIRRDTGGVIESAAIAIAIAALLWQVFLAPELYAASAPAGQRAYAFAIAVLLSGTTGIVVGVFANGIAPRAARPVLGYFTVAIVVAVTTNSLATVLVDPATGFGPWWLEALWVVPYTASWAALAHQASPEVFAVGTGPRSRLSSRRLTMLGLAAVSTPLSAVVLNVSGSYVDWLTGASAHLLVMVLVLMRVNQLASAHRGTEARLKVLANQDVLTGLPNRRAVDSRLEDLVARVTTGRAPGAVLCFIDLDGFKQINDTRGHAAGDELLVAVAARLTTLARVDEGDLVGRLGGDEFVLVTECDPAALSDSLADRIRAAFAEPFTLTDGPATITASVGLASTGPDGLRTVDELLTESDHAMYADKIARRRAEAP